MTQLGHTESASTLALKAARLLLDDGVICECNHIGICARCTAQAAITHAEMFRPDKFHGKPHQDNKTFPVAVFYFDVESAEGTSSLSGYVSRTCFNWLAELLGVAPLSDETNVGEQR